MSIFIPCSILLQRYRFWRETQGTCKKWAESTHHHGKVRVPFGAGEAFFHGKAEWFTNLFENASFLFEHGTSNSFPFMKLCNRKWIVYWSGTSPFFSVFLGGHDLSWLMCLVIRLCCWIETINWLKSSTCISSSLGVVCYLTWVVGEISISYRYC